MLEKMQEAIMCIAIIMTHQYGTVDSKKPLNNNLQQAFGEYSKTGAPSTYMLNTLVYQSTLSLHL